MAKIVENAAGGRRLIRLSSDDVMMVVSMIQRQFRGRSTDYNQLAQSLQQQPFYLPEDT